MSAMQKPNKVSRRSRKGTWIEHLDYKVGIQNAMEKDTLILTGTRYNHYEIEFILAAIFQLVALSDPPNIRGFNLCWIERKKHSNDIFYGSIIV